METEKNYKLIVRDSQGTTKEVRQASETQVSSTFPREHQWLNESTNSGQNMAVKSFKNHTVDILEDW